MPRVLLTGAGGFIGSHVLRHLLTETDWDVVATDSFRHKGKTDRITLAISDLAPAGHLVTDDGGPTRGGRLQVIAHDLTAPFSAQMIRTIGDIDFIIAMASESHVDRSIEDPASFVRNNVNVILSTLDYARQVNPAHIIVISTDEVYGPVEPGQAHAEWAPILPSNPYAASKAAQEAIAISYWRTYGLPLTIVNCMNLIGETQDPEKYLPKVIAAVRDGGTVPVHGVPGNIGTRHYLHARNLADALVFILRDLPPRMYAAHAPTIPVNFIDQAEPLNIPAVPTSSRPDRYNIAGPDRVSNLELAEMVAAAAGETLHYELIDFHSTRPGHDPHYGLDPAKLTAAGWKPPVPFAESLQRTVAWTLAHPEWLLP